jgi:hypothetical protein
MTPEQFAALSAQLTGLQTSLDYVWNVGLFGCGLLLVLIVVHQVRP